MMKMEFENGWIRMVRGNVEVCKVKSESVVKVCEDMGCWKGWVIKVVEWEFEGMEGSVVKGYKDEVLMVVNCEVDSEGLMWKKGEIVGRLGVKVKGRKVLKGVKVEVI
jgi:hypothetical protein